jgi:hypothetical protein
MLVIIALLNFLSDDNLRSVSFKIEKESKSPYRFWLCAWSTSSSRSDLQNQPRNFICCHAQSDMLQYSMSDKNKPVRSFLPIPCGLFEQYTLWSGDSQLLFSKSFVMDMTVQHQQIKLHILMLNRHNLMLTWEEMILLNHKLVIHLSLSA